MATLDLNQLKAQVNKALGDASVVVKFSCATVCLLYLLTFADKSVYPSLAVTPGFIIPPHFRIWTLVTGCFTEYRIWNKFVFILDVGTSLLTSAVCVIAYVATFDTEMFIQFGGMTGILAGMMVAFKQIKSEQELIGSLGLRIKHVPSIVVLVYCVLCIIGILPFILLVMANSGTLIGWVYLRFYQPRCKGVKVFNLLVRFNVCHKPVRTYDVGAPSAITISLPGMDPADAERRRQKALKALNDRLQKLEQNTSWPALDEPGKDNESSMASVEEIPDTVVDQGTNKRTEGLPTSSSVPT
ncbi:Transmembrane protein 115 [Acropora cervicornis]|uniref:Transmembrane protein 115 n=1 Tax=Acropora cervicornis TaxID=6130 RepID=A0AAD9V920_ACRCE|nr:Transmembrane protein 115 [Acropora cervicornis]